MSSLKLTQERPWRGRQWAAVIQPRGAAVSEVWQAFWSLDGFQHSLREKRQLFLLTGGQGARLSATQGVAGGCTWLPLLLKTGNRACARGGDVKEGGRGGGQGTGRPWDAAGEGPGRSQWTELQGNLEAFMPLRTGLNLIMRKLSSTLFTLILWGKIRLGHAPHSRLLSGITGSVPHLEILIDLLWDEAWAVRMLKNSQMILIYSQDWKPLP